MCYKQSVAGYRFAIALALFAASSLFAQCPSVSRDTEVRTLQGRLIFHDALESWFELKLDQKANPKHFEEARGPTDTAMFDLERAAELGKKDPELVL